MSWASCSGATSSATIPGIGSLRLAPEVAAGWKQRITGEDQPVSRSRGRRDERARTAAAGALFTVRAFYLDIAQWAADDPARWAPWAAPCPIRDGEIPHAKELVPPQGADGPADP